MDLSSITRMFRIAAPVTSAVSAVMTFAFGFFLFDNWAMALVAALGLVCISLTSDYIGLFVMQAWSEGRRLLSAGLAIAGVLFFAGNLLTGVGSIGWQTESSATASAFQNTKFKKAKAATDNTAADRTWLINARNQLKAEAPWAATTTAKALRDQVATMNEAIKQEAARVRCGPKCLDLKMQRDKLTSRIAKVEKLVDYDKRLAALKRVETAANDKLEDTPPDVNAGKSRGRFLAGTFTLSLKPSKDAETWANRMAVIAVAFLLAIAPIVCSTIGWGSTFFGFGSGAQGHTGDTSNHLQAAMNAVEEEETRGNPYAKPNAYAPQATGYGAEPAGQPITHNVGILSDGEARKMIERMERRINQAVSAPETVST